MPTSFEFATAVAVLLVLVFIQVLFRSKNPIRKAIFGILLGISSLIAVNITGIFTGIFIPVSIMSVFICAVAGIPGTILLLILNLIL